MTTEHPCPKPNLRRRQKYDGLLWLCDCGRAYALRRRSNIDMSWYSWVSVDLRAKGGKR